MAVSFRNFVSQNLDSQFPAESGRYHLYISYACPWASRCLAILKLKGLDKAISFSSVQPFWRKTKENDEHMGWIFPDSDTEVLGAERDHINGAKSIRELYDIASSNYTGKYTVPVLWDKKLKTIVNNESSEILRMFSTEFNHIAENHSFELYPPDLRSIIDDTNEWIHDGINNGVYKCGFATIQAAYDEAVKQLFDALDKCEEILEKQRFLCGNTLTEPDIRLFVTLVRFDEPYAVIFKCDNFRNLEREYRSEPERIQKWKEALISIPQKIGLTLAGHRDESELVDSIVKEVKKVLIDISSKERDRSNNSTNSEGQSTNQRTQNNIISSFEPLMAELDQLPSRRPPQVFVSFCREELGDNFVRHLVWALRDSGINVSTEYRGREGGFTSIEESKIALAIFSTRYLESDWCLNELVKMDKLAEEGKLVVIPVFYNVKTKEVRRLEGEFGRHFVDTKKRFAMEPMMVQSWEESLNFIINRKDGLSLETHRNEFALVVTIVREVTRLLPNSPRRKRRRKLGIGEVFFRASTATFLFALFVSPMPTPDVNFLKIGNLLLGFPFLVVVLHKVLC